MLTVEVPQMNSSVELVVLTGYKLNTQGKNEKATEHAGSHVYHEY